MTVDPTGPPGGRADPSMLDLLRLSRRRLFPPGGRDLYRQIAILTDMGEGDEVLVASCGSGVTLEYFVREYGVQGSGVDEDEVSIQAADAVLREGGLGDRTQLQHAPMDDLPYRDGVFDVVVGELGLTRGSDPSRAIREIARVLKPGGRVTLVQLVWKAPVEPERQDLLAGHLGVRPLMLVELKRLLRDVQPSREDRDSPARLASVGVERRGHSPQKRSGGPSAAHERADSGPGHDQGGEGGGFGRRAETRRGRRLGGGEAAGNRRRHRRGRGDPRRSGRGVGGWKLGG